MSQDTPSNTNPSPKERPKPSPEERAARRKFLKEQKELDALFKSLKERDEKNETEA